MTVAVVEVTMSGPTESIMLDPICLKDVHVYSEPLAVHCSVLLVVLEQYSIGWAAGAAAIVATL